LPINFVAEREKIVTKIQPKKDSNFAAAFRHSVPIDSRTGTAMTSSGGGRRLMTSPMLLMLLMIQSHLGLGVVVAASRHQRYYNYNKYNNNDNGSHWTTTTSSVTHTASSAFVFRDCGEHCGTAMYSRRKTAPEAVNQGLELSGGWGLNPCPLVHVYKRSFLVKIVFKFHPLAKFQTCRHLIPQLI